MDFVSDYFSVIQKPMNDILELQRE